MYTNSGLAILALASNAVHKLWKWQRNDRNITTKVLILIFIIIIIFVLEHCISTVSLLISMSLGLLTICLL